MVAAFLLDISVFLSSPYMPEVYPHRWSLLEGYLSHSGACSTDIRPVRGDYHPRASTPHHFLTRLFILGLL